MSVLEHGVCIESDIQGEAHSIVNGKLHVSYCHRISPGYLSMTQQIGTRRVLHVIVGDGTRRRLVVGEVTCGYVQTHSSHVTTGRIHP